MGLVRSRREPRTAGTVVEQTNDDAVRVRPGHGRSKGQPVKTADERKVRRRRSRFFPAAETGRRARHDTRFRSAAGDEHRFFGQIDRENRGSIEPPRRKNRRSREGRNAVDRLDHLPDRRFSVANENRYLTSLGVVCRRWHDDIAGGFKIEENAQLVSSFAGFIRNNGNRRTCSGERDNRRGDQVDRQIPVHLELDSAGHRGNHAALMPGKRDIGSSAMSRARNRKCEIRDMEIARVVELDALRTALCTDPRHRDPERFVGSSDPEAGIEDQTVRRYLHRPARDGRRNCSFGDERNISGRDDRSVDCDRTAALGDQRTGTEIKRSFPAKCPRSGHR